MPEGGVYYKKTDDICEDVCGPVIFLFLSDLLLFLSSNFQISISVIMIAFCSIILNPNIL